MPRASAGFKTVGTSAGRVTPRVPSKTHAAKVFMISEILKTFK